MYGTHIKTGLQSIAGIMSHFFAYPISCYKPELFYVPDFFSVKTGRAAAGRINLTA